jgi:hypothetical protein
MPPLNQAKADTFVMRAVIFAAALLAGTGGWLLFASATPGAASAEEQLATAPSANFQSQFRDDRVACERGESHERAACERHARQRLLAGVRHEAARLSLR